MDREIIAAVFGAIFGFMLPYLSNIWDRVTRARRIVSALNRELSEVTAEIESKLQWVDRDVTGHLKEVDKDRIIVANGKQLYLGEREKFTVPRIYWKAKYTEIAEAISDSDFSDFYVMYRLVDNFEQKFREMKLTFETSLGKKEEMALVCFNDLKAIAKELRKKQTSRSSGRP